MKPPYRVKLGGQNRKVSQQVAREGLHDETGFPQAQPRSEKHLLTVLIDADSEEQARRFTIAPKYYRALDRGYATPSTISKSDGRLGIGTGLTYHGSTYDLGGNDTS